MSICMIFIGKDYRIVILSTSEPTNADGSARDLTKSICDPFVFNTVISRARSLFVCVGLILIQQSPFYVASTLIIVLCL